MKLLRVIQHRYNQWRREKSFAHHAIDMCEFLELEADCKLDGRYLRVISLHGDLRVQEFFMNTLLLNDCTDAHAILSVDVKFGRNSNVHKLIIRYWIDGDDRTYTHTTTIITDQNDTYKMLQLGYGN